MDTQLTLLFDLDGTLIDSRAPVDRMWTRWAGRHDLDPAVLLPFVYGHRTLEVVSHFTPNADVDAEVRRIDAEQVADTSGVVAAPAAAGLLASLDTARWAIVTSASAELAVARLDAAGLPRPAVLVSADHVSAGKPSPEGHLMAAERLGAEPGSCVAVDDAPTGIEAAKAARMYAVALTTTHGPDDLSAADVVVSGLAELPGALARLAAPEG